MAFVSDELPLHLIAWLTTNGLHSPLSIASLDDRQLISVSTLSLRASHSFRVLHHKQCIYDLLDPDDETIRNIRADGRVTLQFEVLPTSSTSPYAFSLSSSGGGREPQPTPQLVTIQGTGRVCERGSSPYNALIPASTVTQWSPRAVVSIGVQRVSITNGGPSPTTTTLPTTTRRESASIATRQQTPRSVQQVPSTSSSANFIAAESSSWGGWPVGGDACCAT